MGHSAGLSQGVIKVDLDIIDQSIVLIWVPYAWSGSEPFIVMNID